jgi:hypothetical protein
MQRYSSLQKYSSFETTEMFTGKREFPAVGEWERRSRTYSEWENLRSKNSWIHTQVNIAVQLSHGI